MSSSVGRLALGVAFALAAPVGFAAIGFSIGMAIGGMVFAPDGPTVEGPRLGDTTVSTSSLGKMIPEHHGMTRSGGNMFWSGGIKEIKKEEKQGGGKGGGTGATSVTYEYSASFAMAFGRATGLSVQRIWADSKLIYDETGETETNNDKYKIRFYTGGPNQRIDPLIAESINRRLAGRDDVNAGNQPQAKFTTMADIVAAANAAGDPKSAIYASLLAARKASAEGAAGGGIPNYQFTPSYKELCYILFDDMPLTDFGNRIPNITAEIIWEGASSGVGLSEEVPENVVTRSVPEREPGSVANGLMALDVVNKRVYTKRGTRLLRRFSWASKSEDFSRRLREFGLGGNLENNEGTPIQYDMEDHGYRIDRIVGALTTGDFLAYGEFRQAAFQGNSNRLFVVGGGLVPQVAIIPFGGVNDPVLWGDGLSVSGTVPNASGTARHLVVASASRVQTGILETSIEWSATLTRPVVAGYTSIDGAVISAETGSPGYSYFYGVSAGTSGVMLTKYEFRNNMIIFGTRTMPAGVPRAQVTQLSTQTIPLAGVMGIAGSIYDNATQSVILLLERTNGQSFLVRVSAGGEVVYTTSIPYLPPVEYSGITSSDVSNGELAFGSGTTLIRCFLLDGTYKVYEGSVASGVSRDAQIYVGRVGALFAWDGDVPKLFYVGKVGGDDIGENLRSVITKIMRRAGAETDEFDVSGIPANLGVRGYTVSRPTTARQALEPLLQAYNAYGIESDWKIKFFTRTNNIQRVIDEKELGEVSSPTGPVNWLESRTPEYDLPGEVNLNYSDRARDYQTASVPKRRISDPVPSMYSDRIENVELPLVFRDYEAATIAERMLYMSWMSRDMGKGMLNWGNVDLDPGDVIRINFRDGRSIIDRIGKITLGANLEMDIETSRDGDPVFTPAPVSIIPTSSVPTNSVFIPVDSRVFVFDIPLLYDFHDTGRSSTRYYKAVGAFAPGWNSAIIFQSWDSGTFFGTNDILVDITWGEIINTPQPPRALWTTDVDNELVVSLAVDKGDLVSVTFEEILNGANRALIWNPDTGVGEIIQFQTAVEEDGVYRLRDLQRGLRGTDTAVGQHTSGSLFVLLKDNAIQLDVNELSRVGSTGYFKAVSTGQLITAVPSTSRTFRGKDLMPYAPSRVRRTDNGSDLTITWNRRTRVGGAWNMGSGNETVPLSEDTESYELYLLPTGGAALSAFSPTDPATYLERVTTGTPTHTFSAATLAARGLSLSNTINVVVYQMSAQVGRGFPRAIPLAP